MCGRQLYFIIERSPCYKRSTLLTALALGITDWPSQATHYFRALTRAKIFCQFCTRTCRGIIIENEY